MRIPPSNDAECERFRSITDLLWVQDAWRDSKYVNANTNMSVEHMMPGLSETCTPPNCRAPHQYFNAHHPPETLAVCCSST